MPNRVQLQRVKGWRMPPNTRKVDRTTIFGNPFDSVRHDADDAVRVRLRSQWPILPIGRASTFLSAEAVLRRAQISTSIP